MKLAGTVFVEVFGKSAPRPIDDCVLRFRRFHLGLRHCFLGWEMVWRKGFSQIVAPPEADVERFGDFRPYEKVNVARGH